MIATRRGAPDERLPTASAAQCVRLRPGGGGGAGAYAFPANACSRRFGAGLEAELAENPADVMLDGLDAEEEPFGDLTVCESRRQQFEDLFLPVRQHGLASRAGTRSSTQAADELGGPGSLASCSETVEGGERELRFAESDLGACLRERLRELE